MDTLKEEKQNFDFLSKKFEDLQQKYFIINNQFENSTKTKEEICENISVIKVELHLLQKQLNKLEDEIVSSRQ